MRIRLHASGPATRSTMWAAYEDPRRWSRWAPQIRRVRAEGRLRPGMRGEVEGLFGVRARFLVTEVDEAAGSWSWEVRTGPVRLHIDHEVSDGEAAIQLAGPPIIAAYAPVAHLALRRLVRLSEDGGVLTDPIWAAGVS